MKRIFRIIFGIIFIGCGITVIIFAFPLALPPSHWASVGAFILLSLIGILTGIAGLRIAQGESVRDALSDLFRGLGR
jgi:hypothetical protein